MCDVRGCVMYVSHPPQPPRQLSPLSPPRLHRRPISSQIRRPRTRNLIHSHDLLRCARLEDDPCVRSVPACLPFCRPTRRTHCLSCGSHGLSESRHAPRRRPSTSYLPRAFHSTTRVFPLVRTAPYHTERRHRAPRVIAARISTESDAVPEVLRPALGQRSYPPLRAARGPPSQQLRHLRSTPHGRFNHLR